MKALVMGELYVVKANAYCADPTGEYEVYEVPMFIGLEGERQLIVFEHKVTERTRVFESKRAATEWCKKHNDGFNVSCGDYYPVCLADV